jgi:hypothetical protein
MNVQSSIGLMSSYSQIASQISGYDMIPDCSPLFRSVESLVQPPLMTERIHANFCMYTEILETFFKCLAFNELTISSSRQ